MCMQCEVAGMPPSTVSMSTFATLGEALKYANHKAWVYDAKKIVLALHSMGIVDLNEGNNGIWGQA